MLEVCKIKLMGTEDVKDFCNLVLKFDSDLFLCHGHYVIDAKSIMGVVSLDGTKDLSLKIIEKCEDEFEKLHRLMIERGYAVRNANA